MHAEEACSASLSKDPAKKRLKRLLGACTAVYMYLQNEMRFFHRALRMPCIISKKILLNEITG